jgi:hypothetical protein
LAYWLSIQFTPFTCARGEGDSGEGDSGEGGGEGGGEGREGKGSGLNLSQYITSQNNSQAREEG